MNVEEVISIFNILGMFWMILIIIMFSLALFWNIRFIHITKWQRYSWIKVYAAIASVIVVGAYLYILLNSIINSVFNPDFFGVMILRPIIILLGGVLASSARARLTSLKQGGERWILRKYKI